MASAGFLSELRHVLHAIYVPVGGQGIVMVAMVVMVVTKVM